MGLCSEDYWSDLSSLSVIYNALHMKLKCTLIAFLETSYRTVALAVQPRLIKAYSCYLKTFLGVHLMEHSA